MMYLFLPSMLGHWTPPSSPCHCVTPAGHSASQTTVSPRHESVKYYFLKPYLSNTGMSNNYEALGAKISSVSKWIITQPLSEIGLLTEEISSCSCSVQFEVFSIRKAIKIVLEPPHFEGSKNWEILFSRSIVPWLLDSSVNPTSL